MKKCIGVILLLMFLPLVNARIFAVEHCKCFQAGGYISIDYTVQGSGSNLCCDGTPTAVAPAFISFWLYNYEDDVWELDYFETTTNSQAQSMCCSPM